MLCDVCLAALIVFVLVLAFLIFRWIEFESARNCMMRAHAETMRSMGYVPPELRRGWTRAKKDLEP
jgi:hypothetical protein